jgi:6-phospho-beta-glucosidase
VTQKLAIIGGGSAYAPGLLKAFAAEADAFAGFEFVLMDVHEHELRIVERLGRRLLEGSGIRLRATTDRRDAIAGSDFVLTTFRQGGLDARHLDESVPLKFGVIGQETIGPGGFFFAMRTLPVMREIATEMAELAPTATLVNYSNPTQIVAEAVTRHTGVRCIAICDQTDDDRSHLADALGIAASDIELEGVGLNHATWSTTARIGGEDALAVLRRERDAVHARADVSNRTKRMVDLALRWQRIPNSYLQYYYAREATVAEAQAATQTRAQTIQAELGGHYAHFAEQADAATPNLTQGRGGSVFGDFAVRVLRALATGERARLTLNVPNVGRVLPDFNEDRVVEVPCTVEGGTITPEPQDGFPHTQRGLLRMLADYQAAAADVIWHGQADRFAEALALNPLVGSLDLADSLLAARPELQP